MFIFCIFYVICSVNISCVYGVTMPRYLTPLTVRNYSPRYNVLYQKPSVEDNVGAIKIAGRAVRNFGLNKHVTRDPNTLAEISHFLSRHSGVNPDDIAIYDVKKKLNPFNLTTKDKTLHYPKTNDYYHLYQDVNKKQYYLWIPKQKYAGYAMLRIKANNDAELKQKILAIHNSDTSQAKLECKTHHNIFGKLPFMPGTEIFYNEHKLTGNYSLNAFSRVGNQYNSDTFDTKIGSVDQQQLAYYLPSENFQNYSERTDKAVKVRDDAWLKSHTMSMFVDASTEIDEIIGTIVLQTYAGKKPEPEYVAQMTKKIKDDYLYDTYGKNSRGGKVRQSAIPFLKTPLGKFGTRWQFSNDPYHGNRIWQNAPMAHQELISALYQPQADGSAVFLYDRDPEAFMALADKLAIKKEDKQYMMNYGRKAIATRVTLRLVQDEIIKLNLNDKDLSPEEITKAKTKHLDLIRFQDKVFSSLGDLKDVFRKSSIGYTAYARAVGHEDIPKIKEDKIFNRETQGIPSLNGFVKSATKGLDYVENYAYAQELWGWQLRANVGRGLFKLFKERIFDKEVPDIVVENAASMFAETVDRSSKRMKSFSEFYLKDADLASNTRAFFDRMQRLDFLGASEIINQQKSNINEFFKGRQSIGRTNVKRMMLQNEGVHYNREIWPTLSLKYKHNTGSFATNGITHKFTWEAGEKIIKDLSPLLIDIARFMKAHQEEIRKNGISNKKSLYHKNDFVYQTPEMVKLNTYIRKAADTLTDEYFQRNKAIFRTSPENDIKVLNKQIKTEYMNILNMAVNVVAMVSYADETGR